MPQTQSPTFRVADALVQLVALGIQFRYIAPTWMRADVSFADLATRTNTPERELLAYVRAHELAIAKQLPAAWAIHQVTPWHITLSRRLPL